MSQRGNTQPAFDHLPGRHRQRRKLTQAIYAVEGLETRWLLSAPYSSAAQSAILAAVPRGMHGQFVGSQLELTPNPAAHGATPQYMVQDSNPSLGGTGALMPSASAAPTGFTPAQVRHAYGVDNIRFGSVTGDGTGQTIAIIDAYDDPNAATDLQAFDQAFGLPDPPSFTKVNQTGGKKLPGLDPAGRQLGWEVEESLDIEWAHAMAPAASIILVEANNASYSNLIGAAVNWARNAPGVTAVSMSFGAAEWSGETAYDPTFTTPSGHAGVTFLACTGDNGRPGEYPAYSPNVVAVGGTYFNTNDLTNYPGETGWSQSGGGISAVEVQPAYQKGMVDQSLTNRTTPDVAFDAGSGVAVYDSYDYGTATPWQAIGGTSLATPCWAGLVAIADQGRALSGAGSLDGATQTLPRLYAMPEPFDFHDITIGNNGFAAMSGPDLVTGLGTPIADKLVVALSASGPYVIGSTPSGLQSAAPSHVDFMFNMPMDPTSFSVASSIDGFFGGPGNKDLRSTITGFSWLNGNTTLEVDFTPLAVQGPYQMWVGPHVLSAGGLMLDQNQDGLIELETDLFAARFNYDITPTQVSFTDPASGTTIAPPFTKLDVHFSAPIDPTTVSRGDLRLSLGYASAVTILDSTTVEFTLSGVDQGGTITATIYQEDVLDTNQNPILTFTGSYTIPAPPMPGMPVLLAATDSGVSDSDGITNFDNSSPAKALQFSVPGTVAGDTVAIYDDFDPATLAGPTLLGTAVATGDTTTVVTDGTTALSVGDHAIYAVQSAGGIQSPVTHYIPVRILNAPLALPVPGAYDGSFNGTGVNVTWPLFGYGGYAEAIEPDGKLLVAGGTGLSGGGPAIPAVARYDLDGHLDMTFGPAGIEGFTSVASLGYDQVARSIVLQSDGKIVILVTQPNNSQPTSLQAAQPLEIARFQPGGLSDEGFGLNGIVQPSPGSSLIAEALAIQPDGKFLIAATSGSSGELIRLNSDGTYDSTFNALGYVLFTQAGMFAEFKSLAITPDGHIVVAGEATSANGYENMFVARYTSGGALDTMFGSGGYVITPVGSTYSLDEGIALQADGKIVVSAIVGSGGLALLRYTPGGAIDGSFGAGGIVALPTGRSVGAPVVQPDGRILVAGQYDWTSNGAHGFVDRFNADGSFDTSFGNGGQVLTAIGPSNQGNYFTALAVQADGRVDAAGVSAINPSLPNRSDWTVARFDGATAALTLDMGSDSGISNADRVTNVSTPTFDVPNLPALYTRIYEDGVLVSPPYSMGSTLTLGARPDGTHNYSMTLVDEAGNETPATALYSVTIDTTPPVVRLSGAATGAKPVDTITITFDEAAYGLTLADLQLTRGGATVPWTSAQTLTTVDQITWTLAGLSSLTSTPGNYQLTLAATPAVTDLAGNSLSAGARITWNKLIETTTTLAAQGSNPADVTQVLTFAVTVAGGVPDGETVTLIDASNNDAVLASGTLAGGSATLTIPAGTLPAGTHDLIAVYGGDSTFAASQSAALAQTVQAVVTSVVVNGDNSALAGVQRSMVDSIVYTFSQPVTLASTGAFTIAVHDGQTGTLPTLAWAAINPDASGASAQWVVTFSGAGVSNGSIANGVYDISLDPAAVTVAGAPSATLAARPTDTFYRLYGDVFGTRNVTALDYARFKASLTTYNPLFDSYATGNITALDYSLFKKDLSIDYSGDGFVTTI